MTIKLEYEAFQAVRMYVRNRSLTPNSAGAAARTIHDRLTAWGQESPHGVEVCFGEACRWLLDAGVPPPEVGIKTWKHFLAARDTSDHFTDKDRIKHPMSGWFVFHNGAVWFIDHLGFAEMIERDESDWYQAVVAGMYQSSGGVYFQAAKHEWTMGGPI